MKMSDFWTGFLNVASIIGAIALILGLAMLAMHVIIHLLWRILSDNSRLAALGLLLVLALAACIAGGLGYYVYGNLDIKWGA